MDGGEDAVREQVQAFTAVLDALPHQIAVLDATGTICAVNAAWREFGARNSVPGSAGDGAGVGTNYLDVCGRADAVTAPEAASVAAGILAVLRGERASFELEYPCQMPDHVRWFLLRVAPTSPPFAGAVIAHHDITERKLAEGRALSAEQLHRELLDNLPTYVTMLDPVHGRVLWTNRAPLAARGLVEADVLGRPFWTCAWWQHDGDAALRVQAAIEAAIAGHVVRFDVSYSALSGVRMVDFQVAPVHGRDGGVVYLVCAGIDIHDRSRSERALRESEERLHVALEAASAIAFVWEADTDRVTRYYSAEPALPANPHEPESVADVRARVLPEDREKFDAGVAECLAGEGRYRNLFRIVRPDASVGWLEEHGLLERHIDGSPRRLTGISIDVTERKRAEALVVAQNLVLERIAEGAPLGELLVEIAHMVDAALPTARCAIMRADLTAGVLTSVAAPSLPEAYHLACSAIPIGDGKGSCGTAAATRRVIVTSDIKSDPSWDGFHWLAELGNVASCISQPVLASGNAVGLEAGTVIATFAVYSHEAHAAVISAPATRSLLAQATHLVCLAIERDHALRALRDSEERFRNVLEMSPVLFHMRDLSGRYLYVNKRVVEVSGIPASVWIGKSPHELFPGETADRVVAADRSVIEAGRPTQLVDTVVTDGGEVTFLSVVFLLRHGDGEPYAVGGISADVSERQRAERERERLWNHSPDPLCVASRDGMLLEVNPAWAQVLGRTAEELVGRSLRDVVHPDDLDGIDRIIRELAAGAGVQGHVTRCLAKNGSVRWLSWNLIPVTAVGKVYGFVRDITEQRSLEEQLHQARKMDAIGQLAGGVAHDFNNLLTIIAGDADLLLESPLATSDERELLEDIREAGARASSLTAQLLAFSRKAIVEPRVLQVDDAVAAVSRLLRRLIGEDIELVTELSARSNIRIDPSQFQQVLINLAVNARDAMPRGGRLTIATRRVELADRFVEAAQLLPGPYVEITVTDTGVGIPEDIQGRVFEPFFTTKGVGKGTGLGLATVYGIVVQASGTISVTSEPVRGATFRILLPIVQELVARDTRRIGPAARGTETVLLVEDEEHVRRMTRRILERQGYVVLAADGGPTAIELSRQHAGAIDLVLSDVVMPAMGGREVTSVIRSICPQARVLYMSGYTDDAIVRHGITTASDAFIQKPFSPAMLLAKVREVLDSPPPSPAPGP